MSRFADDFDDRDSDYDELRAEAMAERRARRGHWCETCHGHTGPGSPCAPDEPEIEPESTTDDEDAEDHE
jgi:hypothetical protein